jgi:glycosyltransferase involved in cell wall biosynthesis
MSELDIKTDVCMVGLGSSAPCYYRVMLPAQELECDWVGIAGFPPKLHWTTGAVRGQSQLPDFLSDYKVIVLQQPKGESWEQFISTAQEKGIKVVFEVDDYLHGINERDDHGYKDAYDKRALILYERCMRLCDAMFVSTPYLAKRYKKFNSNIHVCRNGIDLPRYRLTRPSRKTINIGWAGATGHVKALSPWLNAVNAIMMQREDTCFVSVGQNFADALKPTIGEHRAISIPFTAIEQYPSAMSMFDIALAPGGGGSWYRGKSDLRWLEASALGIPIIARPSVYPEIEPGVTGFHATAPHEMVPHLMELLNDAELRQGVGQAAREYVVEHRTIEKMSEEWRDALRAVAG